MIAETQVGPQTLSIGSRATARVDRSAALTTVDAHARYQEAVLNGNVFGLCLTANVPNGANIGAGQIIGGVNAVTHFALWNPVNSGVNLVLWQFNFGYVSGTQSAGPVWHYGFASQAITSVTNTISGNARCMNGQNIGPRAGYVCNANVTGSGLTAPFTFAGQGLPYPICIANLASTATAANVGYPISTTDVIDGKIVITPGTGWIPMLKDNGGTVIAGWSVIWEEIPA